MYIRLKANDSEYIYMYNLLEQCFVNYENVMLLVDFKIFLTNQDISSCFEYFNTYTFWQPTEHKSQC